MAKLLIFLFDLGILFELLWGAHAWFTWALDPEYVYTTIAKSFVFVITLFYVKQFRVHVYLSRRILPAVFVLFVASMIGHLGGRAVFNFFLTYFPLYVLICDKEHIERHVRFVSIGLAVILIPGIILHLFMLVKGGLFPGIPIQYPNMKIYTFLNYGFLLKGVGNYEADGFRFQSVFLEPGYLGTLLSFILYVQRYELKNFTNKILFVALLLTMSLAAYGTMIIGYVVCAYEKRKSVKKILILGIFAIIAVAFGSLYNGGNNVVNEKILSRFELDQEKGISGNNRVSYVTDWYFDYFLQSGELVWGVGSERIKKINGGGADDAAFSEQIRGAGYKIYLINYGVISAGMFLLFYFLLGSAYTKKMTLYMFGFWSIVVITFVQAAYPTSLAWLIPYFMAVSLQKKNCMKGTSV